ncbi:MAG: hypothetical protein PUB18_00445 [bacterium]|nr:hypothetical protein [bacterium]
MNQERLQKVLEILSKYDDSRNVVDYYQLYGLDKNMTSEELTNQIKQQRLQVLFHPDQIHFIPAEYHVKYQKMIENTKLAINAFSSKKNKDAYDAKLAESIQNIEQNAKHYRSQNTNFNKDKDLNQTVDLDEMRLRTAVIITTEKYDLNWVMNALCRVIRDDNYRGFTREQGVRDMVLNIGRQKILSILNEASLQDSNQHMLRPEQVVMNYLTDLVYQQSKFKIQMDCLEQAVKETMLKYDYRQAQAALTSYCEIGGVQSFTNTNGVRNKLVKNVELKNVRFLMQCALNQVRHINPNMSYTHLQDNNIDLIAAYCNLAYNQLLQPSYHQDYEENYHR